MKLKNKWERIQLVRSLGLNTEENVLIEPGQVMTVETGNFIKRNGSFSLRTFNNNDNGNHPHYPVVNKITFQHILPELLAQGYSVIVATCIDPFYAELAGCGWKRNGRVLLEVKYGPVTVRAVSHEGNIDERIEVVIPFRDVSDTRLQLIAQAILRANIDNCIFEFSWYAIKVGEKNGNMIFWEVTGAAKKGEINYE